MEFEDFEPLEDISESIPKKDAQDESKKTGKQASPGDGIGMDDFSDFQAGMNNDDDQSSVYTDDYVDMRVQQLGQEKNRSFEDFDDDYDDIWKNHMPELAQSSSQNRGKSQDLSKSQKGEEKILSNFYEGAQSGFLFDNLLGDNRKIEEPSPIYGISEPKISASSANTLSEKHESQSEVDRSRKDQKIPKKQSEEVKYTSLASLNRENKEDEVVPDKQAESKEIVSSAQLKSEKEIKSSSDVKSTSDKRDIQQNNPETVERKEEQVVQEEIHVVQGGIEDPDAFQEVQGGIQEGDFQSFVDNEDNYSQDDSKYEGSFYTESELPESQSARGENRNNFLDEIEINHKQQSSDQYREERNYEPESAHVQQKVESQVQSPQIIEKVSTIPERDLNFVKKESFSQQKVEEKIQQKEIEVPKRNAQNFESLPQSASIQNENKKNFNLTSGTNDFSVDKGDLVHYGTFSADLKSASQTWEEKNRVEPKLNKPKEEIINNLSSSVVQGKSKEAVKIEENMSKSQPASKLQEHKKLPEREQLFKREAPQPKVIEQKKESVSIQKKEPVPIQKLQQPINVPVNEAPKKEVDFERIEELPQTRKTASFPAVINHFERNKDVQPKAPTNTEHLPWERVIKQVKEANLVVSSPQKKPVVLSQEATKQVIYTPEKKPVQNIPEKEKEKEKEQKVVKPENIQIQKEIEIIRKDENLNGAKKSNIPSKSSTPTTRKIESLEIKCRFHPNENIEKVCVDPNYPKKRFLCFECGVEASKEMQKYKAYTQPLTQYVMQKIQEYCEIEREIDVPQEYIDAHKTLQSAEEKFSSLVSDDIEAIKESLNMMRTELLNKFDEIENSLEELSKYKVSRFTNNREFYEKTLKTHFSESSSSQLSFNELMNQLGTIETEQEFEKFVNTLSVNNNYSSPEVKNYFKVLSHKINSLSKNTKFPNRNIFNDLKSKNVNISQLQEQLLINLTSVKSTIYELLDSSYNVEDITKTRIVPSSTLTPDNTNVTFPLNKISEELVRYRLGFDKTFQGPDSNTINCITIIDNEILVAGTLQKTITIWNLATSECLEIITAHDDIVSGVYPYKASLSDLRDRKPHIATYKEDIVTLLISTGGTNDKNILFWDISWTYDYIHGRINEKQQSRLIRKLEAKNPGVSTVLPVLDGVTLVNGTYDGRICVWNVIKNRLGGQIKQHEGAITSLKMMRCKEKFAAASVDKTISIWRISYKEIYDIENRTGPKRKIFEGFELEKILDPGFKILCLGSSVVNKNWLAFGGSLDRLIIWDIETSKLVKEFECDRNDLTDIVWVEDKSSNKMILFGACNEDDVIRAWDTNYQESNELLSEVYNLKHREKVFFRKGTSNGTVLQLVQDGIIKIAVVNSAKNKNSVSLWNVELGV